MPLIQEGHDALSHLDSRVESSGLEQAHAAIAAELAESTIDDAPLHPSIPGTDYSPAFSPLLVETHEQIAKTGKPRTDGEGIDLERYEEPDTPVSSADPAQWRATLCAAYTSQSYLTQRALNLSLLEKYGKNAWLISNGQVEDELRTLELELKTAKEEGFALDEERRHKQEGVRGELDALQQSWQESLGRAIEAEIAGTQMQQQILDARRAGVDSR